MAMQVHANFLGAPRLSLNGVRITFPTQKITALVFYLLHEKVALRSHLATLFWGESEDEAALGSLRNAIYIIKKTLPKDFFKIDRKTITLSQDILLSSDLLDTPIINFSENFALRDKRWGIFLDGITLTECDMFDNWLRNKRQEYADRVVKILEHKIQHLQKEGRTDDVIDCLRTLIEHDSFEEKHYLRLMRIYAGVGQVSKALKVYITLKHLLKKELAAEPSAEIMKMYNELLSERERTFHPAPSAEHYPFFGRETEIEYILSEVTRKTPFYVTCIQLCGPAGIGKTTLLEHLLARSFFPNPLCCRAYEMSEKYALSPWNSFFSSFKLPQNLINTFDPIKLHILKTHFPSFDVDYRIPENSDFSPLLQQLNPVKLGELLADITRSLELDEPISLICEDFQWFDSPSLEMLQSFLLSNPGRVTLITLQRTGDASARQSFIERLALKKQIRLCKVTLGAFSKSEIRSFAEKALGRCVTNSEVDLIFSESEGIPLLISELLNALLEGKSLHLIAERLEGVIENRVSSLTSSQKHILEYLSVFVAEAFYNDFISLFENETLQLAEDIDVLCKKNFIKERVSDSNHLKLQFSHHRVHSYVYSQLSEFKKRTLHNKIATILEKTAEKIVWDKSLENETIYHYHKAADDTGALIFQLLRLRRHVIINHELFPIIDDADLVMCGLPFSTQSTTEQKLEETRKNLLDVKIKFPVEDKTQRALALFQEIQGGYDIYFGNYQDGSYAVREALRYADNRDDFDIMMRCLLHLSFIGVQTEDCIRIRKPAQRLVKIASEQKNALFTAVGLRFLALCYQFEGNYVLAEKLLNQSVGWLESVAKSSTRYTLNIVAAQNYIGELYHRQGFFDMALNHFENCLSQCIQRNLFWGKPLFHSNISYVFLCTGHYDKANHHASEAIRLFETTPSGRKNSIAYSIKAFIEALNGHNEAAQKYLLYGDQLCEPIMKKSWLALHLWVKSRIRLIGTYSSETFPAIRKTAAEYEHDAFGLFKAIHFNPELLRKVAQTVKR